MSDRSLGRLAPSGARSSRRHRLRHGGFFVNCDNPLLSAQEQRRTGCTAAQIAGCRPTSGQPGPPVHRPPQHRRRRPRTSTYDHENYRIVLGMKGDFADAWHYDAYGSYYYTSLYNSN